MPGKPSTNPDRWVELLPSASEKAIGVIFKAKHSRLSAAIIARRLTKMLDKVFDITDLPKTLVETYSKSIIGFKLISSELITINHYQAAQLQYQYPKRGKTYTDLMLVVPTGWQTIYITLGAKKTDSKLAQKDFHKISLGVLKDVFS